MTSQRGIPRIASVTVDRLALFDKLDRAAPVTFITAPPGFGKTTGLVRWLERSPLEDTTVVWAHLHLDDTVPQRFWMIVADAFAKAGVRVDGRAEHRTSGRQYDVITAAFSLLLMPPSVSPTMHRQKS